MLANPPLVAATFIDVAPSPPNGAVDLSWVELVPELGLEDELSPALLIGEEPETNITSHIIETCKDGYKNYYHLSENVFIAGFESNQVKIAKTLKVGLNDRRNFHT